jgi:phosphatidylinositol alpha 1,6-mannosyltransferase
VSVRIAYVTESFPPDVNGVAHTAVRVAEHLVSRGHDPLIIAPEPARGVTYPDSDFSFPVVRVRSMAIPSYSELRVGLPGPWVKAAIAEHGAQLVHLAGPFVLGASAAATARKMNVPTVAVYATDVPAYAKAYHTGPLGEAFAWRRLRNIHNGVTRTLAPSSATASELHAHGIERVWLWGRGVDSVRFDPAKRSEKLRAELAPRGELLVGYVGRLAPEKRVELLAQVDRLPGVRLVIVGTGPSEQQVRRALPGAAFLGKRGGEELATIYASLDVFAHAGPHDTFGNTLQEAAASGLPVVAPAAGGPIDLVRDGQTGFLVPPGDATAMAAAVGKLVTDPALRLAQGRAGRQWMLGRTWSALCDELIGHYEAVLEAAGTLRAEASA